MTIVRAFLYVVVVAGMQLAAISDALSFAGCTAVEDFISTMPNGTIKQLVDDYLASKLGLKDQIVRNLDNNGRDSIFIAGPKSASCENGCYYHFLRAVDDKVSELFAIRSTGWILMSNAYLSLESEQFGRYDLLIFEMPKKLYIGVGFPLTNNPIFVEPVPAEGLWNCRPGRAR